MTSSATLIASYNSIPDAVVHKKLEPQDENATFVMQRFYRMSKMKEDWRGVMQGTQGLYYANDWEWIIAGEDFERPVRLPTLRDFTKTLVDNFMQDPPEAILKARRDKEKDLVLGKKAYIEFIMSTIHEKAVRREVVEDMFFFGVGIRAIDYFDIYKPFKGEMKQTVRDIATYRIDPRNFFVDENANKLHDKLGIGCARDILIRHVMPWSTFEKKFKDKPGFDISGVMPVMYNATEGSDYLVTNAKETVEKTNVLVVKMYEYENQEEDCYSLVANGKTIYKGTLSECKGTSTFNVVDYKFEPRNDSYWGNNLAQLIAPHIYLKDTLFNLEVLNLKLTLQPVMAVSGDFGYNQRTHVMQPGGVWTAGGSMNGKLSDNIQPIIAGNPNTKVYDMLQNLNSELSITTRADLRTLEYYAGKTATEVNEQKTSMNAHNETIESITEVESEAKMYEIINEVMMSFMDEKDDEGSRRRIEIKGYQTNQTEGQETKFTQKSGFEDFFDLTEEIINVDCEIVVQDRRRDKAMKMEKMGRIMQFIPMATNVAMSSPEVAAKLNLLGLLEEAVEYLDLNPEKAFKESDSMRDEYEVIKEEILLGNEIMLPEGMERKDAIAMLKFLMAVEKTYTLQRDQSKTLESVRDQCIDLIKTPTMDEAAIQAKAMPPMGAQGTAQTLPPEQGTQTQVQPPMGGVQKVAQPDSGLISPLGTKPNQI